MFEFSLLEGVVIGMVALLVLGPTKLLEISRVLGRWLGKIRRQYSDIKDELSREIEMEELRKKLADEERALKEQMHMSSGVNLNESLTASTTPTSTSTPSSAQEAAPASEQEKPRPAEGAKSASGEATS